MLPMIFFFLQTLTDDIDDEKKLPLKWRFVIGETDTDDGNKM
jgi:hypothetical protein